MYITDIPARIIIAGDGLLHLEMAAITNAGTMAKTNAFRTRP